MWNLVNFVWVLFWSLFSAVDMPYDSDEEADYSKMDLVGSILTESYFWKLINWQQSLSYTLYLSCDLTDNFENKKGMKLLIL